MPRTPPKAPKNRLYLDNAATSFPKPPGVAEAVANYMTEVGASPGRGAYAESRTGASVIADCRELIADLIGLPTPERIIFTLNCTDALNMAIKGVVFKALRGGRRPYLITTPLDHNSVLRPYNALAERGWADWSCLHADPESGLVDPDELRRAIRTETALVSLVHASNVTGVLQPIDELVKVCREAGVPVLIDAAQSAGHLPINMAELGADFLAFPGHKGLLGPLGTGVLAIRPGAETLLDTWREGGTGSASEQDTQPEDLPDRFEPGSHNTPAIAGLACALRWLHERGIDRIRAHELELIERVLDRLPEAQAAGYRLLGPPTSQQDPAQRVAVFSFAHESVDPHELADRLEHDHAVLVRAGIHCAPRAHETHATISTGALRLSFGPFNTPDDADRAMDALIEIEATLTRAPIPTSAPATG
ncbi:MAG: aminotransferase class V-fold PLP-dependent enzyme [Phycisphaerales bacterium]|nr:aminotransferase class V-fold PLP-dependent enzyme [Phycisphaerales bacterium]